jgi:hypothetical protein
MERVGDQAGSLLSTGKTRGAREKTAAVKLQAATRGRQGRKDIQWMKTHESQDWFAWIDDVFEGNLCCLCSTRPPMSAKYNVKPMQFPGSSPAVPPKPAPPPSEAFYKLDIKAPMGVSHSCVFLSDDATYILQTQPDKKTGAIEDNLAAGKYIALWRNDNDPTLYETIGQEPFNIDLFASDNRYRRDGEGDFPAVGDATQQYAHVVTNKRPICSACHRRAEHLLPPPVRYVVSNGGLFFVAQNKWGSLMHVTKVSKYQSPLLSQYV